ncbi:acetate--CoA ligase [Leptospirillum ferriphilum]|uniref:Acetate--CoA ligase n=1 Tax=Leptospirillum ferriphilum (strain ML-04) TaxID=1048260 RepID=J9Z7J2_LEPFM|nr:acetate--CoA ligase [Leptospirillum ferriphilum]AFS52354.1 acyl-coenzyme A synthetase [Leptospirillum ferriphilum ML-04]OOH79660.1 acetate--CoA ligase [Leptospirillum ferriphilum]
MSTSHEPTPGMEKHPLFHPPEETLRNAHVQDYVKVYQESIDDPAGFWGRIATELEWFTPWTSVLDWDPQTYTGRWFPGGTTNISHNALDRHVAKGYGNKVALIWSGDSGEERVITYSQLLDSVERLCHALHSLGLEKGDRVSIFLPPTPEQVISMLACARMGLIHSVVFSGFSEAALKSRMEDAQPKLLITADAGFRRGKEIPLLQTARAARTGILSIRNTLVVRRKDPRFPVDASSGEKAFDELLEKNRKKGSFPPAPMGADDPLFILYTSGTTGKPKGIVHVQPGYMVGTYLTTRWVFDIRDSDVYFCVADPGWITGHSYIVYGPLLNRTTVLMAEGAPDWPDPGRWWKLIEKYRVTVFYSTPTAVRLQMRHGEKWPSGHDLSSLRLLGSVGEPINPEAWMWFRNVTGGRLPIMDTWWQTETGMHMITPLPSTPLVPGSATKPFPGVEVDIVDKNGNPVPDGESGLVVIKKPWPAMFRTVFKDPDRYRQYWTEIPGMYFSGDSARRDSSGFYHLIGRIDDVIKVAGHRLGTAEVESALVSHPAVAEAAVIGKPDSLKGESLKAFVILRQGKKPETEEELSSLRKDIRHHVREELGAIAQPDEIEITDWLPKTRSGKIMRRVLRARELGLPEGDTSTLED